MDQAKELRDLINKAPSGFQSNINARVITISSGKGGVGKSNFSLNLAIYLSSLNQRVLLIDADFGLANIEVLLNVRPQYNFYHIIKGQKNIMEVMIDTPYGIKFISGGNGLPELANITNTETKYFIDQFAQLDKIADIIIIDTGAGISKSVTNFLMASDEPIILTTPEPTSFTDAYTLIKIIKEQNNEIDKLKMVINKCDDKYEGEKIFVRLSTVIRKFLGIEVEYMGYIPLDIDLVRAVKQQKPAILAFRDSDYSKAIINIGNTIMNKPVVQNDEGVKGFMKKLINIFAG